MHGEGDLPPSLKCDPAELRSFTLQKVGKYGIGSLLLGKGAGGDVYKGVCTESNAFVAIKRFSLDGLNTGQHAKLKKELELLKSLQSPNVVRYIDSKQTARHLYIITEYMDAGSVASLIRSHGPFPEILAACVIKEVLQGIQYLHSVDVIHRDIKGGNVLISTIKGSVKLADFGLSVISPVQRTNSTEVEHPLSRPTLQEAEKPAGSPYWMAPEAIKGDRVVYASDIWSAAVTVCEMICGKPPLFDLHPASAMFRIVESPPQIPTCVTSSARGFLKCAMKKSHHLRPAAEVLLQHRWIERAVVLFSEMRLSFAQPFLVLIEKCQAADLPRFEMSPTSMSKLAKCIQSIEDKSDDLHSLVNDFCQSAASGRFPLGCLEEYDDIDEALSDDRVPALSKVKSLSFLQKAAKLSPTSRAAALKLILALIQNSKGDSLAIYSALGGNPKGLASFLSSLIAGNKDSLLKASALMLAFLRQGVDITKRIPSQTDTASTASCASLHMDDTPLTYPLETDDFSMSIETQLSDLIAELFTFWSIEGETRVVTESFSVTVRHLQRCISLLENPQISAAVLNPFAGCEARANVGLACISAMEVINQMKVQCGLPATSENYGNRADESKYPVVLKRMLTSNSISDIDLDSTDVFSPNAGCSLYSQNELCQRVTTTVLDVLLNNSLGVNCDRKCRRCMKLQPSLLQKLASSILCYSFTEENQTVLLKLLYNAVVERITDDKPHVTPPKLPSVPYPQSHAIAKSLLQFVPRCYEAKTIRLALSIISALLIGNGDSETESGLISPGGVSASGEQLLSVSAGVDISNDIETSANEELVVPDSPVVDANREMFETLMARTHTDETNSFYCVPLLVYLSMASPRLACDTDVVGYFTELVRKSEGISLVTLLLSLANLFSACGEELEAQANRTGLFTAVTRRFSCNEREREGRGEFQVTPDFFCPTISHGALRVDRWSTKDYAEFPKIIDCFPVLAESSPELARTMSDSDVIHYAAHHLSEPNATVSELEAVLRGCLAVYTYAPEPVKFARHTSLFTRVVSLKNHDNTVISMLARDFIRALLECGQYGL